MQRLWCYDEPPTSAKFALLGEAVAVLDRAHAMLESKLARKRAEEQERKDKRAGERERIKQVVLLCVLVLLCNNSAPFFSVRAR